MKFNNVRIGTRLAIGFAVILALMTFMAGFSVLHLKRAAAAVDEMDIAADRENLAQRWIAGIVANGVRTLALLKSTTPEDESFYAEEMNQQSTEVNKLQAELQKAVVSAEGRELLAEVARKRDAYVRVRAELVQQKKAPGTSLTPAELKPLIQSQFLPARQAYIGSVQKVVDHQSAVLAHTRAEADADALEAEWTLILLATVALVLGALLAWRLARGITMPIDEALTIAQTVAAGDLSRTIDVRSRDETGQLMEALKLMSENLSQLVGDVRHGSDTIATASNQIASGNQDLSSRTEEQASSLEETAASMEQLTSTVKQNADNARQANQLALSASDIAVRGGVAVNDVVETMGQINASSKKIVEIIGVIEGIAFQTNILALNAAVEAARAGEQGRGFAVVASEVRSLAQRSAAAAKEIKLLIDDSVNKVGVGNRQVAEAGRTMEEIVASVGRVTDIMGEISVASQEQTTGINQINQAIAQMDQVTQQNAALVEEAAAAAASMQEQAGSLVQAVGVFKVGKRLVEPEFQATDVAHAA
jgi:methyl-accepting chemotaxis protein